MKRVLLFQLLILAAIALPVYFYGARHAALSYVVGGFIVTANFIMLGSGWKMVFNKKLVALAVLFIVFKYAILGIIIYAVVKQIWLLPFWFAAGVSSMMMASLAYGLTLKFFKED